MFRPFWRSGFPYYSLPFFFRWPRLNGLIVQKWLSWLTCSTSKMIQMGFLLAPWKPTWHWKIPVFNRKYIFKWWVFHCHVSFPGGVSLKSWCCILPRSMIVGCKQWQRHFLKKSCADVRQHEPSKQQTPKQNAFRVIILIRCVLHQHIF